jgi:hypothetical protein
LTTHCSRAILAALLAATIPAGAGCGPKTRRMPEGPPPEYEPARVRTEPSATPTSSGAGPASSAPVAPAGELPPMDD